MDNKILEVKNLKMYFTKNTGLLGRGKQYVQAVDDISFYINKGETFGLVGESGSGKTTVGRTIIKLYEATGGEVYYKNEKIIAGEPGIKEKIKRIKNGLNENTLRIEKTIDSILIDFKNINLDIKKTIIEIKLLNHKKSLEKNAQKIIEINDKIKGLTSYISELEQKLPVLNSDLFRQKNELRKLQEINKQENQKKLAKRREEIHKEIAVLMPEKDKKVAELKQIQENIQKLIQEKNSKIEELKLKNKEVSKDPKAIKELNEKVNKLIEKINVLNTTNLASKKDELHKINEQIHDLKLEHRIGFSILLHQAKKDNIVKPTFRKSMQMIFQDPYASLNSRMTVADIIAEPLKIHGLYKGQTRKRVYELLEMVGLSKEHASRYPHEFSGGQRQRIGVARALAVNPEFIICDEPISALDVSIQAQVINLLEELQEKLGLTYLFIAHDLSMVKHISNRIAVMYLGKIVEITTSKELFKNPLHPYTKALLSAVPVPSADKKTRNEEIILEGDIPSPINPPSGCRFRTRCQFACERCIKEEPQLHEISDGHIVACHLLDK